MHANEAAAVAMLHLVYEAEVQYATRCANGGYAFDLDDLRKSGPQDPDGFLSRRILPNAHYHGYVIALGRSEAPGTVYLPTTTCNRSMGTPVSGFFAAAAPDLAWMGLRFFAIDQHGEMVQDSRAISNPLTLAAPKGASARP
jgi:hypothetical protein